MKITKYISILLVILIFASCHTAKKAVQTQVTNPPPVVSSVAKTVKMLQDSAPYFKTAKANLSIDANLKGRQMGASGMCKMVTDSAIHLSVMPLLNIELFKIEFTPQKFVIIDKMNNKFYESSYSFFKSRFDIDVSFNDLQSLVGNRLFLLGKDTLQPDDFEWQENNPQLLTLISKQGKTEQQTILSPDLLGRISSVIIKSIEYNSVLTVNYADFQQNDAYVFPNKVGISAEQNGEKKASFDFEIKKITFNEPFTLKPANTSKYTRGDINSFFKK